MRTRGTVEVVTGWGLRVLGYVKTSASEPERKGVLQQIAELPGTLEILRTTTKAFRNGRGL
jgi:hypothetical protein